jgi:uncharacterized 2Fe-2S/4Fe-4S cluster protein (DUF4445 family)
MARDTCRVVFQPEGRAVHVLGGTTIYEAAGEAGIIITADCGGVGTCGRCRVIVTGGSYRQQGSERFLSPEEMERGEVLACRARVTGDLVVEIPLSSRLFEQKVLTGGEQRQLKLSPNLRKKTVTVEEPTLESPCADLDRLWQALGYSPPGPLVPVELLRLLPEMLRQEGGLITVVLDGEGIIGMEPGDTSTETRGVAFDIGTTTVVGYLLDLSTGTELAVASRTNPQTSFGDDVVSRIQYASTRPRGLENLNRRIVDCMNDIIRELAAAAGVDPVTIYQVTTTGNTTMGHLFLGINPRYLALNPYVGVFRSGVRDTGPSLGLSINRFGTVYTMPGIGGFVGGDTVGVILSSGMHQDEEIRFAVDIGTNGELVMGNRERLVSCSTAAGPAFEGARIAFGMRASDGAVEKVEITGGEVQVNTIGNAPPVGICGTGLIDAVAELLRAGIIKGNGKMLKPGELPSRIPDSLRAWIISHERHNTCFVLVPADQAGTGSDILLTQKDVRETQLAKGAIMAGYRLLMKMLGVTDRDIAEVLLAGAFGNYIRKHQAIRVGLIPDFPEEKITFIGNAAGVGSKMVLLSRELREEGERISGSTEYVELATSADFQKVFAESMFFPEEPVHQG